jgi:hypothetical protein
MGLTVCILIETVTNDGAACNSVPGSNDRALLMPENVSRLSPPVTVTVAATVREVWVRSLCPGPYIADTNLLLTASQQFGYCTA